MQIKSTKAYHKLPCAHMQHFDTDESGTPCSGPCAKWHGYDRSVIFEFSGTPDEHGWLVGFGDLKPVKAFLEYYFDHTALVPADDPRMSAVMDAYTNGLVDLRVLPYGVSMEMSSLFIWEQVNPFIMEKTNGRAFVSRVECREHDSNSAFIDVEQEVAVRQWHAAQGYLITKPVWNFMSPRAAMERYS